MRRTGIRVNRRQVSNKHEPRAAALTALAANAGPIAPLSAAVDKNPEVSGLGRRQWVRLLLCWSGRWIEVRRAQKNAMRFWIHLARFRAVLRLQRLHFAELIGRILVVDMQHPFAR